MQARHKEGGVIRKYTLTGLISQALNDVRERILGIYREILLDFRRKIKCYCQK
jgi:hypothetical protein